jgi:hypothetical protein
VLRQEALNEIVNGRGFGTFVSNAQGIDAAVGLALEALRFFASGGNRPFGIVADEYPAAATLEGIIECEALAAIGANLVDRRSLAARRSLPDELICNLNPHGRPKHRVSLSLDAQRPARCSLRSFTGEAKPGVTIRSLDLVGSVSVGSCGSNATASG